MKRHIFIYLTLVLVLLSILSGMIMYMISSGSYYRTVRSGLISQISIVKALNITAHIPFVDDRSQRAADVVRLMFIHNSGKILADTQSTAPKIEDPLQIVSSVDNEQEQSVFVSTLGGKKMMIAASRYDKDTILVLMRPVEEYDRLYVFLWYWVILGTSVVILIAVALSSILSHQITKPVEGLGKTFLEIAQGNYHVRAKPENFEELNPLAATFNTMVDTLVNRIYDLKDANIRISAIIDNMNEGFIALDRQQNVLLINVKALEYLHADNQSNLSGHLMYITRNHELLLAVDELMLNGKHRMLDLLIEDKEIRVFLWAHPKSGIVIFMQDVTALKKMERLKSEFTANVSHELKTPLTSIKGFTETLKGGALDNREVAMKFLDIIGIEVDRLSTLINDILQISEIETMQIDVNIAQYPIRPIVDQALRIVEPSALANNVHIEATCEDFIINANNDRIMQLLINLIDNAIKYNKPGGHVNLFVEKENEFAVFRVKDTGIGIAPEDKDRIFERFYSACKSRSKHLGGTGLGLSIVKHITNLYHGNITVNSSPGEGSEFIIRLRVL